MGIPWTRHDPNVGIDIDPGEENDYEITDIPIGTTRVSVRVKVAKCPPQQPSLDPVGEEDSPPDPAGLTRGEVVPGHVLSDIQRESDYRAFIQSPGFDELVNPGSPYYLRLSSPDYSPIALPFNAIYGRFLRETADGRLLFNLEMHPDAVIRHGDDFVLGFGFESNAPSDSAG